MNRSILLILPAMLVAGSSIIHADTIGPDCATCDGAAYTLTYSGSPISSTSTTQTFQITLDVNDASYIYSGAFLNAVAIKVAAPSDILSTSLVSAPTGFSLAPGYGLNANGCAANGSGFICAQASGNGAPVAGSPYDFIFDVEVNNGTLLTGTDAASIKALYVNSDGNKVGSLLSEDITLQDDAVPEPSSIMLLGCGLLGTALFLRKKVRA